MAVRASIIVVVSPSAWWWREDTLVGGAGLSSGARRTPRTRTLVVHSPARAGSVHSQRVRGGRSGRGDRKVWV